MPLTYVCSPLSAPSRAEMLANAAKVVKANADSFIEELAAKGYCDLTQFESVQGE